MPPSAAVPTILQQRSAVEGVGTVGPEFGQCPRPVAEPTSKEWRKGHRLLLCYLRVRGVVLPWAIDIYLQRSSWRRNSAARSRSASRGRASSARWA